MLPTQWKYFLSELIGVFALIFIGAGAAILSKQGDAVSYLGVALAFGVSVTCIIGGISTSSSAHLNPVVTLSLCATGRCSYRCLLYYTSRKSLAPVWRRPLCSPSSGNGS